MEDEEKVLPPQGESTNGEVVDITAIIQNKCTIITVSLRWLERGDTTTRLGGYDAR